MSRSLQKRFRALSRRALIIIGLLFVVPHSSGVFAAETELRISPKPIRDEVRSVVQSQLKALQQGDFEAAYALASRGIKMRFDVTLFAAMMRRGYAPLLRAGETDLGIVRDRAGEEAQLTVAFIDAQKRNIVYRYFLVKEPSGRVNGVTAEQVPARGDV